jgi:hypothetical protein
MERWLVTDYLFEGDPASSRCFDRGFACPVTEKVDMICREYFFRLPADRVLNGIRPTR